MTDEQPLGPRPPQAHRPPADEVPEYASPDYHAIPDYRDIPEHADRPQVDVPGHVEGASGERGDRRRDAPRLWRSAHAAASRTCEGIRQFVGAFGLTVDQQWRRSRWQPNLGKLPVRVVLAALVLNGVVGPVVIVTTPDPTTAPVEGVVLGLVSASAQWVIALAALYALRHVPTRSRYPACTQCNGRRVKNHRCERCGRSSAPIVPARRRAWRSL